MSRSHQMRTLQDRDQNSYAAALASADCSTTNDLLQCSSLAGNQEHSGRVYNPLMDTSRARLERVQNIPPVCSPTRNSDSDGNSYYFLRVPWQAADRLANTSYNATRNRLARFKKLQQLQQHSQNKERMNLDYENAWQCSGKKENLTTCEDLPREQRVIAARKARQYTVAKDQSPQSQQFYASKVPAYYCSERSGRPMDIDRDLTYRRLNQPTPKKRRSRTCPPTLNGADADLSVQQLPGVYQLPAGSKRIWPSKSISPLEARYFDTSASSTLQGSIEKRAEYLVRPAVMPSDTSGTLMVTRTARQIQKPPFKSPQRSRYGSSARAADGLVETQTTTRPRRNAQHNLNVNQEYSQQLEAAYGQSASETNPQIQYTLQFPTEHENETDQITKQTEVVVEVVTPLGNDNQCDTPGRQESSKTITNEMLAFSPHDNTITALHSNNETIRNRTGIKESTAYGRQRSDIPSNSYANETQYALLDMDLSEQVLASHISYPTKSEEISEKRAYRDPQEDFTGTERATGRQKTTVPTSAMQASVQILDHTTDATQYLQLPASLEAPCYKPQDCRPSSYRPTQQSHSVGDQTVGQICDASTFGTPALYSTALCDEVAYSLSDSFDTPCHNVEDEPPASVKECANAKRCGHVQFDSSDKRELQDPHRRSLRQVELENLVNDTYCPGIIQETIDGLEDFNKHSLRIHDPRSQADGPITLVEAFSRRVDKERAEVMKNLRQEFTAEQIEESIRQHFAQHNPTDLNRAIKSFLLSEQLLEHDEREKSKVKSFEAEIQNWTTSWPGQRNIKFVSYTGRTRPTQESEHLAQGASS